MAIDDWDPLFPADLQDSPWSCSAASLSWGLQACGVSTSEAEVVLGLGPTRISPALGLLDATGAGLVAYLDEIGIQGFNAVGSTFEDLVAAAGHQPLLIGGARWNHWSGVRLTLPRGTLTDDAWLVLANPSPGWMGVFDLFDAQAWFDLGPFNAVWWNIPTPLED